jgi:tellurite resistance protein TerC
MLGLSVDNVFVFYVIFETFKVPERFQRRILQWGISVDKLCLTCGSHFPGIFGALLMRGVFIATGIQLLERFQFVIFIFGGLLVVTGRYSFSQSYLHWKSNFVGFKLLVENEDDEEDNLESKWFVKLFLKHMPYVDDFGSGRFFISIQNRIGMLSIISL